MALRRTTLPGKGRALVAACPVRPGDVLLSSAPVLLAVAATTRLLAGDEDVAVARSYVKTPDAPRGLCPRCMIAGVATPSEPGIRGNHRIQPPPLATVAAATAHTYHGGGFNNRNRGRKNFGGSNWNASGNSSGYGFGAAAGSGSNNISTGSGSQPSTSGPDLCRRFNAGTCRNGPNNCTTGTNGTGSRLLHRCSYRRRDGRQCREEHPECRHR